jgi:hypothetical protein
MGKMRDGYKILVRNPGDKRPLRSPRCARKDYIRMDLREIKWKGADWMHFNQDKDQWWALMNMVINLWVP